MRLRVYVAEAAGAALAKVLYAPHYRACPKWYWNKTKGWVENEKEATPFPKPGYATSFVRYWGHNLVKNQDFEVIEYGLTKIGPTK